MQTRVVQRVFVHFQKVLEEATSLISIEIYGTPGTAITHRANIRSILQSKSVSEKSKLESEHGCRYSILLELPYFDPVRMLLIDPPCIISFWVLQRG